MWVVRGETVPYHREEKIKCLVMSGCFNSSNNFSCTECCSFSVAKYLIHFHSCEEVHTEDKLAKFPITSPPVCIIRWLIVSAHGCLISDLFSGTQYQASIKLSSYVHWSLLLCSPLDNMLSHCRETWARWTFFLGDSHHPSSIWTLFTLHPSYHPSPTQSSIKSFLLTPSDPRERIKTWL